jgi:midasin
VTFVPPPVCRRVKIDVDQLYSCEDLPRYQQFLRDVKDARDPSHPLWEFRTVVWTKAMKRLFTIVDRCLEHKVRLRLLRGCCLASPCLRASTHKLLGANTQEPLLLVGETGCGKTTICQLMAALARQRLLMVNCHQHTETSDFIGGLRPVRGKEGAGASLRPQVLAFLRECQGGGEGEDQGDAGMEDEDLRQLVVRLERARKLVPGT